MLNMKILICHPSPIAFARLRSQLMTSAEISSCTTAASLTDTYNFAEHHQVDCVVLAASFADREEFELLDTLFRIIGIGCVLVQESDCKTNRNMSTKAKEHVVFTSGQSDTSTLIRAIKSASTRVTKLVSPIPHADDRNDFNPKKVILIGASTGGIDALLKTTQAFSNCCPPTIIVQHTGGSFARSLIRLLDRASPARVTEALEGSLLQPGHIYLPPGDTAHLLIETHRAPRITLQSSDTISGHRPSIDALFTSALPYARHVTAALLTGMGRDGAQGLTALRKAGAHTIGQNEATSVVYGMPRIAKEMGGVSQELPLDEIGPALLAASSSQVRV
jgi:two-component system chemotaxis response regulator CheB